MTPAIVDRLRKLQADADTLWNDVCDERDRAKAHKGDFRMIGRRLESALSHIDAAVERATK